MLDDASYFWRQRLPNIILVLTYIATTSAQLQGRPPWELTYQIDPSNPTNSPYQLLQQQQLVPQQHIIQQQEQQRQQQQQPQQSSQPNTPSTFTNPSPNPYREYTIDIPKGAPQQPQTNQPQSLPNPQVQSSQHTSQQVPLQSIPYFQQAPLYNFQPYTTEQESSFDPKLAQEYSNLVGPAPIPPPPPPQASNAVYSRAQRDQFDDFEQKLQLQLQITQQIQQQIEQLQKLQELNRQSINQQKKLLDQGKLDLERGGSSQQRQPVYERVQQNQQRPKTDSQEIYTPQSLLPQSTIANLQFAPPIHALQRPPQRFVPSPLFLENVTDSSLPYYLVAPSLNSVSFFDRLPNGGLEGRAFLPYSLDLTTAAPITGTATQPGLYGESASTVTSNEIHTPTEVPNSSESTERNGGIEAETATAQRRSQSEVTTISPRVSRQRLQNSIRRFVTRG